MKNFEYPDILEEYCCTCPFCGDEFISDHLGRKFCPEKFGKKDWCKNKYKRVAEGIAILEQQDELPEKVIVPPALIQPIVEAKPIAPPVININPQVTNLSLLGAALGLFQRLKLPKNYLPSIGAIYEEHDHIYQMPGTEIYVRIYGPYAIAWGYQDQVILTYKKHIPWIQ